MSVKTVVQCWDRFCISFAGIVKTARAGYPKKFLEEPMEEWPEGSHLVLETEVDNCEIVTTGYNYNKKKVICFISHKNAGSTSCNGYYEAAWKDRHLNTMPSNIPHLDIVGNYFWKSNLVDIHN